MPPRTVLHLSSTSGPGGAETLASRIAAGLDRTRFRSIIGLFTPGWLKDRCERLGLPTFVVPMASQWDLRWIVRCCKIVRRQEAALIHAHEFRANSFGTLVARLCGIPLVATVHGKNYYPDQVKRRIAYRWVSRAARMVAVSHDLRRFLEARIGIPRGRITVIHNGVDTVQNASSAQIQQTRLELGIGDDEFVIGIVGSLYPVKGHMSLLDAMKTVLTRYPKARLVVIGQGDLEQTLKRRVSELGIERAVSFLGLRDDVPRLLPLLDLFVLPSLSEGLSVALLEAMSAGVAVIASNVGGNPEIVVNGETGYLVPAQRSEELASRIIALMSNPELTRLLGSRGKERVSQEFTTARMLEQYQALYDSCLS
jgi:glycosyltransferase involved in cell wall biosynthesis